MADNKIEVGIELNLNELRQDLSEAEVLMQQGVARLASVSEQAEAQKQSGSRATSPAFSASEKNEEEEAEKPKRSRGKNGRFTKQQPDGEEQQETQPPGIPVMPTTIPGATTTTVIPPLGAPSPNKEVPGTPPDPLAQSWERLKQIQGGAANSPQVANAAAKQLQTQALQHGIKDPGRSGEWEKLIQATQDLTRSLQSKHRQDDRRRKENDDGGDMSSLLKTLRLGGMLGAGSQAVNSAMSGNLMGAAGSILGGGAGMLVGGPAGLIAGAGIGNAIGSSLQGIISSADSARQYQINQAGVAARFGDPSNLESLGIENFYRGDHSGYKVAESLQLADNLRDKHVISDPSSQSSQELIEALQALTRATGQNIDALTNQYAGYKTAGGGGDANEYMAQVLGGAIATGFEGHTQEYGEMLNSARNQVVQRAGIGDEDDSAMKRIQSLMLGLMGGEGKTSSFLRDNPAQAQQELANFLKSGATSQPYGYESVAMQIAGIDASETSEAYTSADTQATNATKRMGYVLNNSLFSAEGLDALGMSREELAQKTQEDPDFLRNKLSSDNPDNAQAKRLQDLVNLQFSFQYQRDPKSSDISMLTQLGNVSLANNGQIPLNAVAPDGQKVQDLLGEADKTPGQEALDSIAAREDAIARGLEKLTPALNALDKTTASFVEGVTDLGDSLGIFDSITGAAEGFASGVEGALTELNKSIESLVGAAGDFQKSTEGWLAQSGEVIQTLTSDFMGGAGSVVSSPDFWEESKAENHPDAPITHQLGALGRLAAGAAGDVWRGAQDLLGGGLDGVNGHQPHDRFNDTPTGGVIARADYNTFQFAPGDIIHAKQNRDDFAQELGSVPAQGAIGNYPPSSLIYSPPPANPLPTPGAPMGGDGNQAIAQFSNAIARFEQAIDSLAQGLQRRTPGATPPGAAIAAPPAGTPRAAITTPPPRPAAAPAGAAPQRTPQTEISRASLDRFQASMAQHNDRFARLSETHVSRLNVITSQGVDAMAGITGRHNERFNATSDKFLEQYGSESSAALENFHVQTTTHGDRMSAITTDHNNKFGFTTEEFNTLFSLSGVQFNDSYSSTGKTLNKDFDKTSKDFSGEYKQTSEDFNQSYKKTNDGFLEGLGGWFGRMFGMLGQMGGIGKAGGGIMGLADSLMGGNTGGSVTVNSSQLDEEQSKNAAIIIEEGRKLGASEHDIKIAIATAMQESTLRNLDYGDADSVGLFQQRPSMDWGSVEELTTPAIAAQRFFQGHGTNPGLLDVEGREQMSIAQAAQTVQRSAFPDAYAQHEALANEVVDTATIAAPAGASAVAGAVPFKGVTVTSAVDASGEPGLDYVVEDGQKGAQFGALAAGEVIEVVDDQNWESHLEAGDTQRGYGNTVIVRAIDQMTGEYVDMLYAHLDEVTVQVGQQVGIGSVLGTQGRTGSTTGAHVSVDFFGKDSAGTTPAALAMRDRIADQLHNNPEGLNQRLGTNQNISYKASEVGGIFPAFPAALFPEVQKPGVDRQDDLSYIHKTQGDFTQIHKPDFTKEAQNKAFDKMALPKPILFSEQDSDRPDLTIPYTDYSPFLATPAPIPFGEPLPPLEGTTAIAPTQSNAIPFGEPLPPITPAPGESIAQPIPFGQPLPPLLGTTPDRPTPGAVSVVPFGEPLPPLQDASLPPEPESPLKTLEPLLRALIDPLNQIARSLSAGADYAFRQLSEEPFHTREIKLPTEMLHYSAATIMENQPIVSEDGRSGGGRVEASHSSNITPTFSVTVYLQSSGGNGDSTREQARQGAYEGLLAARDEFSDGWDTGVTGKRNQPRMRTRIH
jgi:Peptidase family M23